MPVVNGGVQDSQAITALLEQDCNVIIVSDASGQMASVKDPKVSFEATNDGSTTAGLRLALSLKVRVV